MIAFVWLLTGVVLMAAGSSWVSLAGVVIVLGAGLYLTFLVSVLTAALRAASFMLSAAIEDDPVDAEPANTPSV